ncbi:WD40/YVTN/BNR-like repeat-containing protein [Gayadomonas joobiniege]|uniref:WD40/YVTN/BNR-like repeat-containing protein n=1 Tax=Gayadomonas joobiniege TaxID=1234606 RepID=UPI0009DA7109|nr:hypothetical protein [Gayadomonas joobiniege]
MLLMVAGINPYDPEAFKKGWYDEQLGFRLSHIAVDPSNDSVWYVGAGDFWNVKENHRSKNKLTGNQLSYADYVYILKSADKGKTWQKISNGLPDDLDVGQILVDPRQSNTLLMLTNHGLMESLDAGLNWHKKQTIGLPNERPRDLTYHYNEKTGEYTLYLVEQTFYHPDGDSIKATGGVFKSTDGGASWLDLTGNLAFDLSKLNYKTEVYRYYRAIAHWFSISWNQAKKQFPVLPDAALPVFNRLVVNPQNPDEIYLTYNKKHDRSFGPGHVWRTLDAGKSWHVVAREGAYWHQLPEQDKAYWQSRGNPVKPNVEFAHVQAYMDVHHEQQGNRLLNINSNGELFISVAQQTQMSDDKGANWRQIDDIQVSAGKNLWVGRGNSDLPGRFMLHSTGIKDRRLMASGEHGLWQTVVVDGISDKQAVAMKQIEGQVNIDGMVSISTVAVHPKNPDIIYITAWRQDHRGQLRRSTDGGKSWENISTILKVNEQRRSDLGQVVQGPPGLIPAQNSLLIDPVNSDNMYLAVTLDAFSEIYRAPRRKPTVGGFGVMKSTDGGYSWQVSNKGFHPQASIRMIALDPNNSKVLYAAASDENGGLYKSIDQGSSWQKMKIPEQISSVNHVFIDANSADIYISAGGFYHGDYEQGGAWRSSDQGKSWQQIFKAPLVLQLESSPVDKNILLLTAGNQMNTEVKFTNPGLYLSLDAGRSWKKINNNLSNYDKIIDAKPDPYNANVLWAAGWGSGWYVGYINGANGQAWHE